MSITIDPSAERLKNIDRLFTEALEAAPGERSALLARIQEDDPELAREVAVLLELAERPDSRLMPERVLDGPLWAELAARDAVTAGARIGAYRVLHEIGRGGMATVFLAERADGSCGQRVALKVLRQARGEAAVRRFAQERQILAAFDHPSIARLLDGGVDEQGCPYIVMEHVEGMPIDRYCDERRLSIDQRLDLFAGVARALHYAHGHGVVHRDLKPSNILVTGAGEVKLLDFGIAKLLDPTLGGPNAARLTTTGMRVMTLEYASPEQMRGDPVTPASDVYQLGLLLYLLLTGQRAYDLQGATLDEAARLICSGKPRKLSAVAVGEAARRLRGGLEGIVEKALRKEPERRYPSLEPMIADLDRHRSGRTMAARLGPLCERAWNWCGGISPHFST